MIRHVRGQKITLNSFNNLTKSLSFNIYDICYAKSEKSQIDYLEYIDEAYNSEKLLNIIKNVTKIINAKLVNVSTQDYQPRGASVTALINETDESIIQQNDGKNTILGHLDKSHITVHTYPEHSPQFGIATFRADIDVSTCGTISPLKALNYLIQSFESDIVIMDYKVRGFTRDINSKKHFIDHDISSIQDYIREDILSQMLAYDINIISANLFHTKMMKKNLDIKDYLFGDEIQEIIGSKIEEDRIIKILKSEIQEIFEGANLA